MYDKSEEKSLIGREWEKAAKSVYSWWADKEAFD